MIMDNLQPRFAEGRPMRMVGLLNHYGFDELAGITAQWQRFQQRLPEIAGQTDSALFGVCYPGANPSSGIDYLTAAMVGGQAPVPQGMVEKTSPAARYAVFEHRGHVESLLRTLDAVFQQWLPRSGCQLGGHCSHTEVYGEHFDPLSLDGVIEIWVPLRES